MPTQLRAAFEVNPLDSTMPESIQLLMFAMVDGGIRDLVKEPKGNIHYNTARFWFFGDYDEYPLGFPRICEHFGVDVGSARKAIKKLYRVRF
ncbi:hypothetical protein LCGC14_0517100 [marine sediment metagenome]|uniref:Uncharacterized protein n=1 Tax=marine sediment metagenome TaxID=412755 RepID=A0A0F9UL72_9ZZZZ